ncbi:MAG: polyprenyl synthetase family protein [Bacteroidaceae bacterium]|nr:polyprenyl synthetase family protein [Bacteroidaceae bacterium]
MDYRSLFNEALKNEPFPAHPEGLYEPIRYTLEGGGKRVRPVLLLTAAGIYGASPEEAMPAAMAIETYHNSTLLHDDLMDRADLRHAKETVWKKWGTNTAVLSGDTMLMLALRKLQECRCERQQEIARLFIDTIIEICEGQQMDMNFETQKADETAISEYLEMIRLKTSVLVACAAKAGGMIAGADEEDCNLLYAFAEKVGLAFQLQDDMLDVWGDASVFGKANGGDIACGKKTYPLLTAVSLATGEDRKALLADIDERKAPEAERISRVTAIYDRLGVRKLCEQAVSAYYDEARAFYNLLPLPDERKSPLWQWAEALLGRKR